MGERKTENYGAAKARMPTLDPTKHLARAGARTHWPPEERARFERGITYCEVKRP